jgi:hypothetical protein
MLPFLKFLCMLGSVSALRMTMSGPGPSVQRIDVAPRQGLRHALALGASSLLLAAASRPTAVAAKVFFDTDTYGDKELKIATVNKIKQKLRNAILDDPALAPDLLRLSINDALSYNAQTEAYGPDGAIQFELDREENKGLAKAVEVVQRIKKELQRTNTVSFSDLVAFGTFLTLFTSSALSFSIPSLCVWPPRALLQPVPKRWRRWAATASSCRWGARTPKKSTGRTPRR